MSIDKPADLETEPPPKLAEPPPKDAAPSPSRTSPPLGCLSDTLRAQGASCLAVDDPWGDGHPAVEQDEQSQPNWTVISTAGGDSCTMPPDAGYEPECWGGCFSFATQTIVDVRVRFDGTNYCDQNADLLIYALGPGWLERRYFLAANGYANKDTDGFVIADHTNQHHYQVLILRNRVVVPPGEPSFSFAFHEVEP